MSSLKMTFSLTSLILISALVAVMPVMAHDSQTISPPSADNETITSHNHPVNEVVADDPSTDDVTENVPAHNSHPMVTSITLKAGDTVRGTMAAVTTYVSEQTTGLDPNEFILVIDFDQDVVSDAVSRTVEADGASATALAAGEFTALVLGADNLSISSPNITIGAPARVTNDDSKWEAVVLVDDTILPTGTAGDSLETVRVRIRVKENAVYSLATIPQLAQVPGGGSQASDVYEFTLVNMLPTMDTTAPAATVKAPTMPDTDGNLVFNISFSEAVTGFGLGHVMVTGGTKEDFVTKADGSYDVTITPDSATSRVTVSVAAGVAMDASKNTNTAGSDSYSPDGYVPSIMISAADGTGTAAGKVVFTLNFSDAPNAFSVASLSVTNAAALNVADLKKLAMATTGSAASYTLTVTPSSGATSVALTIGAGVLQTADDPTSFFAGVTKSHTIMAVPGTPGTPGTGNLATGDTRDNVTKEATFTLPSTMLAPGKFVVIAPMARTDIAGNEIVFANLPNLQRFFAKGGTISLIGGTSDAGKINKSVVITEIMWGLNSSAAIGMQADKQWIELYNTDNANNKLAGGNASVDLSKYNLVFTPTTTLPKPANLSDQISNIELGGWNVDIGSSGALGARTTTFSPVNMVSMYRNIVYDNVTKVHNKDDATKNRNGQLGAIPSGNNAAGWIASKVSDTFAPNQLGSPGVEHFVGRAVFGATNVGRTAVVITEVGNNSNDAYDWVELTAIANTNLEKYELQHIDKDKKVTVLAQFVKKELKAGEILLVVQSNPLNNPDHPIAAGKEWKKADVDREMRGTHSLYHVDSKLKIPNDKGKALFVLRNEKGKTDHNNIVDLAGNSFVTDNADAYRTNLWPLRATSAGHGNVIDGDVEDFNSGRVYQRNDRASGIGEKDWSVRGWTGIGYKRSATNNGQNGGTPGFDNGSLKEKDSDLMDDATVSISEIMYDRGARDNLPQWIELHNSSATQAINLNEWKLKIENDSSDNVDVRTPAVTIANLGGTIILPNQTVLIVSYTTGRVSRGSQGNVDFPSHRVISLSGKGELEIPSGVNKRNYRLLSETGFRLTLIEKGGGMVDTAGNLSADGTAMWELPMSENGSGRSSIIRRYNTKKATGPSADRGSGEGMKQDIWILAANSALAEVRVNETFYGSPDDQGTPGYRAGGALPVSLSKFRPERLESGEIVVRWVTESELNNAGFNILRSETRNGEFAKINTSLIAGQGTTSERAVYEWKDTSAKPNGVYYYQIQDVSLDGKVQTLRQSRLKGDVSPAGKLTTTWGELKALQ